MNTIKKLLGKLLHGFTKILSFLLDIIINILNYSVSFINMIKHGFGALLGIGGCFIFFMIFGRFAIYLLTNPNVLLLILFIAIFPFLGSKLLSYLRYVKYMLTEYLFDRSNHLINGTHVKYHSLFEYGDIYKKTEEAKWQREHQQEEQKQSQKQNAWEERFKQWQDYQNSGRTYGNYGSYGGYNQNSNSGRQPFGNPTIDFKRKYEESCTLLGVTPNSDKDQIKLAYRKKAKEYHPDMNKSANATEMFQKINDAYEFLSDSNIEQYKNMY